MIAINLLPDEFRAVERKTLKLPFLKYAVIGGVIFSLITAGLYVDFLAASIKLGRIQKEWEKIQPQFQVLNQLRGEVEGTLKQEKDFMQTFVTSQRSLTRLIMWVSELLPETAWLVEIQMERAGEGDHFLVKGLSLPTKEKSSIEQIEIFLQRMKEKLPDAKLSLTTTRQTLEGVELTQFVANFDWGIAGAHEVHPGTKA